MKNVYLFGPPAVGKGLMAKLLDRQLPPNTIEFVSVGALARQAMQDPQFQEQHGTLVETRRPLPKDAVCGLVGKRIQDANRECLLLFKGFGYNTRQINWAYENDIISADSTIIIVFYASQATCLARARDKRLLEPDPKWTNADDAEIRRFYTLFKTAWETIHRQLIAYGIPIIQIAADRDLIKDVFPDVLAQVKCVLDKAGYPTNRPTITPLVYA